MTSSFHKQTADFLARVNQAMPGLSKDEMQYWIGHPKELQQVLAGALRREPVNLVVNCSEQLDIAKFLNENWKIDEEDERSQALKEVDFSTILLETCLSEGEDRITGEEKLKRLKAMEGKVRLGGNVFLALWQDYQSRGQDSVLEWLRKNRGVEYLDFFGLVLRNPRGRRSVLYLYWNGSEWDWYYHWLDVGWISDYFSVLLAS